MRGVCDYGYGRATTQIRRPTTTARNKRKRLPTQKAAKNQVSSFYFLFSPRFLLLFSFRTSKSRIDCQRGPRGRGNTEMLLGGVYEYSHFFFLFLFRLWCYRGQTQKITGCGRESNSGHVGDRQAEQTLFSRLGGGPRCAGGFWVGWYVMIFCCFTCSHDFSCLVV